MVFSLVRGKFRLRSFDRPIKFQDEELPDTHPRFENKRCIGGVENLQGQIPDRSWGDEHTSHMRGDPNAGEGRRPIVQSRMIIWNRDVFEGRAEDHFLWSQKIGFPPFDFP